MQHGAQACARQAEPAGKGGPRLESWPQRKSAGRLSGPAAATATTKPPKQQEERGTSRHPAGTYRSKTSLYCSPDMPPTTHRLPSA